MGQCTATEAGRHERDTALAVGVEGKDTQAAVLERQKSLDRIKGIDTELGDSAGFFERRKRTRLLDERKKLLAKLRADAKVLESRLDEVRQRMVHTKNSWYWFTTDEDPLLQAEAQELEAQLNEVLATLEDLGDTDDEGIMREGELENAMKRLEQVQKGSATWDAVVKLVNENSERHTCHYNYRMKVKSIWRVPRTPGFKAMEEVARGLGRPTPLFHGTSVENAAKIVKNGFELPRRHAHGGMFGKGIYFAKTPLKSVNYSKKEGYMSRFSGWLFSDPKSEGGFQMLLCDVYLGRTRTLKGARPNFKPDQDLKGGMFSNFFRLGDYDSVHVPGGFFLFNAVNVTEYVVYEPHQAIPRYLIEFDRERVQRH